MPHKLEDLASFAAPGVFVVLWASGFVTAKLGLADAEPLSLLAVRMVAAVTLIGVIALLTQPKWPSPSGVLHAAITGSLMHGCYLGGVFTAIKFGLPTATVALVVSLQPVLTSTLANYWLGERVRAVQWLGLALGIGGVYLIVGDKATTGGATPVAWAASVVALAGITVGTIYQKRFGGGIDWRPGLFIQYGTALVMFAIGAFAFETRVINWSPQFILAVGWLVLVGSVGAVWLLYYLIRRSAATRVVSLFYVTPPVTALLAWLFFDDRLTPRALAGMAVCIAGVFLVNWKARAA